MPTRDEVHAVVDALVQEAKGRNELIRLGWLSLRLAALPPDAPQVQIDCMEEAFYAGAQHLFATVMNVLSPDAEPTEADLVVMQQISEELNRFLASYKAKHKVFMPWEQ